MKFLIGCLLTLLTVSEILCDTELCKGNGDNFYLLIGCKPNKDKPDDICASSYDCRHLEQNGDFCYFQGKKLNIDEDTVEGVECNGACTCSENSTFICPAYDCPEFFQNYLGPGCHQTYKLGKCCADGEICPPFDNVTTCELDGVTYKEGQRFSPKDSCKSCVCQKGFNGKLEEPFCTVEPCETEIHHSQNIKKNCAPIYVDPNVRCCPMDFLCPKKSDVFTTENEGNGKICKFGNKDVKNGSVLKTAYKQYGQRFTLKCVCDLPPLLSCLTVHSEWI